MVVAVVAKIRKVNEMLSLELSSGNHPIGERAQQKRVGLG